MSDSTDYLVHLNDRRAILTTTLLRAMDDAIASPPETREAAFAALCRAHVTLKTVLDAITTMEDAAAEADWKEAFRDAWRASLARQNQQTAEAWGWIEPGKQPY